MSGYILWSKPFVVPLIFGSSCIFERWQSSSSLNSSMDRPVAFLRYFGRPLNSFAPWWWNDWDLAFLISADSLSLICRTMISLPHWSLMKLQPTIWDYFLKDLIRIIILYLSSCLSTGWILSVSSWLQYPHPLSSGMALKKFLWRPSMLCIDPVSTGIYTWEQ